MRVEDGVGAGFGLCTCTQAVRCTRACNTSLKAGLRRLVPADLGNSRRARGGGAGASRGRWAPGTHGLAEDFQVGARLTFRSTFVRIEGFARVQPARAHAGVGVSRDEDDKIAGSVVVAVLPAVGPTTTSDGKLKVYARLLVVAESGDEGRCAG